MARLTSRELCKRTCKKTGAVTFHSVDLGKCGYALRAISEKLYRQYESMAEITECLYSKSDALYSWQYKTVRYSVAAFKSL